MSVVIAAALPCGLLIGLLLGALGGGGSILAVPALVYLLGQSAHDATAGALVVVAVGSVPGLACHARAGRTRWAAGMAFGALGTAGTYVGSRWSAAVAPTVLMTAFAGLMFVVAVALVLRSLRERRAAKPATDAASGEVADAGALRAAPDAQDPTEAQDSPGAHPPTPPPAPPHTHPARITRPVRLARIARIAATATAVGLLTGFFGVGGGFLVVPALTLVLGLEMPVAIGTSLLVILINSLTALATRAGTGALDWPLLTAFAACAAIGSYLGNRLTTRLPAQTLTAAFAALVTLLAVTMAAAAIPRL
ncbi:sulfite exporter TauE/SafE family protein [Streptomyces piniterrae]|uniref:Probable membrane transporter protein n=1 Tax=Streptomyces piniterrae TaxID=2571125 RepID=A0A4V5MIH5_9ACTN|nr:sulfite exporter TauE/SafE family protein [Streptomyces piniterrae]TJZ41408.1 sulfite exporter TauE/SafE family protein [Streptomyces piniterrae]